ncbi:MAG TPA: clostripain-related cysteine peptidase, partial [Thermoplasmata archaeon]|nr:clostripain-related cysteine peptidase [Thermoplasmata archaeon]
MRPAAVGAVLLLILVGLAGPLLAPARAAVAEWTFMVYLDADNDLESVGITDFLEMSSVGSSPAVNVVVQFDRSASYDTSHGNWATTKRFLVQPGMAPDPPQALMDLGEVDMADPTSLVGFVTWAATAYPAQHYFLDLWDHGLGWQGILQDGSAYMRTAELGTALAQIQAFLGRNVDIVGNDACRMTLEIMYELQPYVDYFVGSQKDEPLAGWPYDRLLAPVVADPSMTPAQVGAWLAAAYVSSYRDTN